MRKIYQAQLLQPSEMQSITYKVNSEVIRWEMNETEKEKDLQREGERERERDQFANLDAAVKKKKRWMVLSEEKLCRFLLLRFGSFNHVGLSVVMGLAEDLL